MAVNLNEMPKLGFGLMRLPQKDGKIDIDEFCRMADMYMEAGLNYFDTAYTYHGGKSESAAKEAVVKRYPRESFKLTTKLPGWELKSEADRDRIFNEQLERAGVDYFDFYLLHSIENENVDVYEKLDCFNWGLQKKAEGRIRHFGFSFHGSPEMLERLLDENPEIEFVQIQLNYIDWDNPVVQSGRLYDILSKRNIPIIVMEPVKGGSLAKLKPEIEAKFRAVRPDASAASWAFRYVASLPGVMTILSGMTHEDQMRDNISTFTNFKPLTEEDRKTFDEVIAMMKSIPQIGCTACRYCVDGCPMKIGIPDVFRSINFMNLFDDTERPLAMYKNLISSGSGRASDCIACGQCEGVCPQHLPVISLMKDASAKLDVE